MDDVHSEGYRLQLLFAQVTQKPIRGEDQSTLLSRQLARRRTSGVGFKQGFRPDSGQLLH